jgi:uncharacterized membrane protein YkvA (DUF1232 family)
MLAQWKLWARTIKRDAHALCLAARDPRVPWYAKGLVLRWQLMPRYQSISSLILCR